jgi:hypothetical protein
VLIQKPDFDSCWFAVTVLKLLSINDGSWLLIFSFGLVVRKNLKIAYKIHDFGVIRA